MKNNKKTKQLTVSQKKELEDWEKKIESGEAYKIAKDIIMNESKAAFDPERSLIDISKTIIPKLLYGHEKLTKEEEEKLSTTSMSFGIENDLSILTGVEEQYRGLIMNLRRSLIKEFECETYSEKALVDLVASSYSRIISITNGLTYMAIRKEITPLSNTYMSVLSKEVDRANRQFITALETLKQFRQPELKVNVKTKNAFIAEKQQFNQSKQDENIKDK